MELRARVGPFTRSKQLRMVRTEFVDDERVTFERVQARRPRPRRVDPARRGRRGTITAPMLTMHLEYTGELWSMNVLGRILDDEVRRSTTALAGCSANSPRAEPPVAAAFEAQVEAERVAEVGGGEHGVERPGGHDASGAHQHRVRQRRRHVLDVMGDDDERRRAGSPAK